MNLLSPIEKTANTRLKEEIERIDATYDDIERETGISRNTWMRMTKPDYSIKIENVKMLSDIFGVDDRYIFIGERSMQSTAHSQSVPTWAHSESLPTSAKSVHPGGHFVNEDNINYDPTEFVSVPYYPNVYASGGQGLIAENESNLQILFRRYFFSKTIQASPEGCFVVKLKGDSMQPMFKDGSDLLVDSARTKIKEGPAFMIRIDDDHYCKLLAKLPDGTIRMTSVNQAYQPIIGNPKTDDFEIIGEVVWDAHVSPYV